MTDPPTYITPRVGPRTVGIVLVVSLAIGWLAASQAASNRMLAVGSIYGLASVGWAMVSTVGHGFVGFAVRIVVASVAVYALSQAAGGGWERYLLHVGGMMVGQNAVLSLLRLPSWQSGASADGRVEPKPGEEATERGEESGAVRQQPRGRPLPDLGKAAASPQFGIVDVMQSTAVLAVLFAVGRQWAAPVAEPFYWIVLLALWLLVPALTGCVLSAVFSRRGGRRWVFGLGLITLAIATSVTLASADAWGATIERDLSASAVFGPLTQRYAGILLAFTTVAILVALAARGDGPKEELRG